ncbi:hypothetical protein MRX96_010527 [Rhipicephalus microplus]
MAAGSAPNVRLEWLQDDEGVGAGWFRGCSPHYGGHLENGARRIAPRLSARVPCQYEPRVSLLLDGQLAGNGTLRVCRGRGIRIVDSRYAPIVMARPRHRLRSQKPQEPPRPRSMRCIARPPPPLPIVGARGMPQQSCVPRRVFHVPRRFHLACTAST